MPRKKQGQASRVAERLSSDAKVKKITKNGVTKLCNETTGKIPNHKFSLCEIKKVPSAKVDNFSENGASASLKGSKCFTSSIPVNSFNNLHNTCKEIKLASQAVLNVLQTVKSVSLKTDIASSNYDNDGNVTDLNARVPENLRNSSNLLAMNNSKTSFSVDEAASKRAGISVITRFNIAKETSSSSEERFDFLNCLSGNSNNDTEKDQPEVCSEESRVQFNHSESGQSNYRISSTVIETRPNNTKNDVLTHNGSAILSFKEQQYSLSSVYGMPATSIEKVLTGLPFQSDEQSCLIINSVSDRTCTPIIIPNSASTVNNQNNCSPPSDIFELSKSILAQNETTIVTSNSSHCRPKLQISDFNNTEEYNSLQQGSEQKKAGNFLKITSPQILEQHISKIISQNTAIVETLDPLWSKRYMRQSSQNADSENKKSNVSLNKGRRLSNDKSLNEIGSSKLQSALLGTLNPERRNSFSSPKINDVRERSFSTSSLPTARAAMGFPLEITNSKLSNASSEEEMKGNAIKSLLSLKQGKYLSGSSSFQFPKDTYSQHPQNPEGSIIKDLLLKTKCEAKCSSNVSENSKFVNSGPCSEDTSDKPYCCQKCNSKYPNEKLLDVHMLICSNKSGLCNYKSVGKIKNTTNGFLVSKFISAENMPILNPSVLSSSIEDLLRNDHSPAIKTENESVGQILKTQLLSPLTNRRSPPLKKRKISEPIVLPNKQKDPTNRIITARLPTDTVNSSAQRCRSQSLHLFGGEVQINDGDKMKRLKVLTSVAALSPTVSTNYSSTLKYSEFEATSEDIEALTTVSSAEPVHNSGDTVTEIPDKNTFSLVTSVAVPATYDISRASIVSPSKMHMVSTSPHESAQKAHSPVKILNNVPVIQKTENLLTKATRLGSQFWQESSIFSSIKSHKTFSEYLNTPFSPGPALEKSGACSSAEYIKSFKSSSSGVIKQNEQNIILGDECSRQLDLTERPAILLTPSSPTQPFPKKDLASLASNQEAKDKRNYLSPARPTSLPLKRKPFTLVGSTLISPDTPRPKKSCVQMYINGQAYTYLGLKCSTRSTYCCIYRPQPVFVLQETDPKLSMYSNWQVVPAKEELGGGTPGQMLSFYNSRQSVDRLGSVTTTAKLGEPLSVTHSSYWTFRSLKKDTFDSPGTSEFDREVQCSNPSQDIPEEAANSSQSDQKTTSEAGTPSCSEDLVPSPLVDRDIEPDLDNSSNLEAEASISDAEGTYTQDEDDDDEDDGTEINTDSSQSQPPKRVKIFEGGFKSNEDYTYIRGRGRGKYVCEECGIRCKKPSMLKKHIRTHTDLRPYKCRHCSFAFKTKGNLTKHMKSKAHHKKCTELGIVPVPTTSDDSQIDEEALARQEQLRKRNLLFSDGEDIDDDDDDDPDDDIDDSDAIDDEYESDSSSMVANRIISVTNGSLLESDSTENIVTKMDTSQDPLSQCSIEEEAARSLLHLSSLSDNNQWASSTAELASTSSFVDIEPTSTAEKTGGFTTSSIIQHQQTTSVLVNNLSSVAMKRSAEPSDEPIGHRPRSYSADVPFGGSREHLARQQQICRGSLKTSGDSASDELSEFSSGMRRYSISVAREARKPCIVQSPLWAAAQKSQTETAEQPMDLRISRGSDLLQGKHFIASFSKMPLHAITANEEMTTLLSSDMYGNEHYPKNQLLVLAPQTLPDYDSSAGNSNSFVIASTPVTEQTPANTNFSQSRNYYSTDDIAEEGQVSRIESDLLDEQESPDAAEYSACSPVSPTSVEDNFAMQEGSTNSPEESNIGTRFPSNFMKPGTSSHMEEGKCICRICNKIFAKAGQLRIHVNIHYFERPFRCDNCGVSFRTKGHLQKHKRSVSHYNKVNMNMTFGTPSVDNPRPFKCADCKIAFRIHGHLAKHLRSKMHIMKLECLGKLPFGMYAEMERSGISLNEIDTTDCSNSLESLQVMAQKLYQRDPRRMRWHSPNHDPPSDPELAKSYSMVDAPVPEQLSVALNSPNAISVHVPSIVSLSPTEESNENEMKPEPSEPVVFQNNSVLVGADIQLPSTSHFSADQSRTVASQHTTGPTESTISLHRSDTCHICGRMFKSAKFLQVHLYCDHSSWSSNSSETLSPSSPRMTVIAQDLSCDLCGRHFPNQSSLQQHLLTHAQLRPFVCEVCDAGFTSSASLITHLGTHHALDSGTE